MLIEYFEPATFVLSGTDKMDPFEEHGLGLFVGPLLPFPGVEVSSDQSWGYFQEQALTVDAADPIVIPLEMESV